MLFLHPRTTDQQRLKLINLNGYCKINDFSSIVVENYLVQKNIHLIIGALSSALYYSKVVFNKKEVYYINNDQKDFNNLSVKKYLKMLLIHLRQ